MNRQTKRQMAKGGGDKAPTAPKSRPGPAPAAKKERVGPRQYVSEARGELRKVAWPTRDEVVNSSVVVLIAVIVLTAIIFAFDWLSSTFVFFLFD